MVENPNKDELVGSYDVDEILQKNDDFRKK